ncbi:polyferredoxin [Peptoniphilus olsenii]|uniref:Polyferredoxin n=2 Tax=Peptoniphilus olsenii TaxID=411570 RepID=A0ABV2J7G8_9FIRM
MVEKIYKFFINSKRHFIQLMVTFFTNFKIQNFFRGNIYSGNFKKFCVPGLNCYSCPAAIGACPIGAFQAVVGGIKYNFSYYVAGMIMFFGTLIGRFVCGYLCPFGFFQDIIFKIKTRKYSTEKLQFLKSFKFIVLIFVVWIMPVFFANEFGATIPYFCKYICPQGILEGGIPLAISSKPIRASLGNLFIVKFLVLFSITALSVIIYRPFCKFICPLGAFYAPLNKVSFLKYSYLVEKCINCGKCKSICDMDVDMRLKQNSLECIRCDKCRKACPTNAINRNFK